MEIRHSNQDDIIAIKNIYAQPSCYANTLQLPFPSDERWNKMTNEFSNNFYSLVCCKNNDVIGQIGIELNPRNRRKHVANIGMAVSENHQGQGVGSCLLSAAIELTTKWQQISRIELTVYTDNKAGISLYEKHGFVKEGEAKKYAFKDGVYADVFFMALIIE